MLNQPKALYGQAVIKVDNCLYTIGGTSGHTYFSDVHKLDLVTRKWTNEFKFQGDLDRGIPSRFVNPNSNSARFPEFPKSLLSV